MAHPNNFLNIDGLLKVLIFSYISILCEKAQFAMVLRTTLSQVFSGGEWAQINRNSEKTSKKH